MELRNPVQMLNEEEERKQQEELKLLTQDCLLLFQSKSEEKDWFIVEGRIALVNLLEGMLDDGNIDIDNSFVMSNSTQISQRFTVREFIKIVNNDLLPGQHILYIDDEEEEDIEE